MTQSNARPRFLPVLILALAAVALLRAGDIWVGFNSAAAQIAGDEGAVSTDAIKPVAEAQLMAQTPSQVERRLLDQLAARREELDKREEALDTREQLLAAVELKIDARMEDMKAKAIDLENLLARRAQAEAEEYEALSSAYERMKPRDAARIFEVLDDDILVPVAAGMRTQAISGVLAQMNPEKAKALTRNLARTRAAGQE